MSTTRPPKTPQQSLDLCHLYLMELAMDDGSQWNTSNMIRIQCVAMLIATGVDLPPNGDPMQNAELLDAVRARHEEIMDRILKDRAHGCDDLLHL